MRKTINIDGKLKEEGTTASILNIEASRKGINLTEFIRLALNKIAKQIKSK